MQSLGSMPRAAKTKPTLPHLVVLVTVYMQLEEYEIEKVRKKYSDRCNCAVIVLEREEGEQCRRKGEIPKETIWDRGWFHQCRACPANIRL